MELKGMVALVTGAAQGIGKATAEVFAKEGASIVLNDINEEGLKKAAKDIEALGVDCLPVVANTSLLSDVEKMYSQAMDKFGRLDILVNNAGITRDSLLHKMTEEQWKLVIDVNLTGVFFCLQGAAKIMRANGGGRIVNISSVARYGNVGQANYSSTKAAVVGLTRTAAKELARKNIRVNCVAPGPINTEMLQAVPEKVLEKLIQPIPLQRVGTPEELANTVLFLASDKSSYITGQIINCDGGWFMA
ncbi:MAG: 3-oxoacyl-ACP reductase FabG [Deltaproteobacteria bacterium]|nr:3-oxoacyl-ACP reductase FabG [Deltaproteobacteria bacterium]